MSAASRGAQRMLLKGLRYLTQAVAVIAQVAVCHEFSKFYAEEDERMTAVRAVLERRLEIKLPRLKIDSPAKCGRNPTTDGTAYCDENVSIRRPISLAQL